MTRSRGTSLVHTVRTRNLARIVVAGIVLAGSPLAMAGTANAAAVSPKAPSASDEVWDQIAKCESGGRWNTNTGNGYSGGLQFSPSTWRSFGGRGSASHASRAEQIAVAERVVARQGWGAWPVCSRKVSARAKSATREVTSTRRSTASRSTHTAVKPVAPVVKPVAPATRPSLPAPAVPVAAPGAGYTVVAGDTLSAIAQRRNTVGGWQALYNNNRGVLSNPNALRIGQQLNLG